jgi:outer membrane receptor for ferrienterochelin and colicins
MNISVKHFVLLLFSFLYFNQLLAQSTDFKGKIICEGKSVAFAIVTIKETKQSVQTDNEGQFVFKNLVKDTFTLSIRAIGFESKSVKMFRNTVINNFIEIELLAIENGLNEVVISGTLKEISRKESTVSVEVISPKLFQQNPTPNIFEAIGMVNGVRPQLNCNVCNTGDIHINGMEGPYTMVMIDGMPIVSALSTVYGLMGIPNSIIERVEIQRGPASTLYGSEAVGGLINIITKNPLKAPKFSVDFNSTSYLENNLDMAYKLKLSPKIQSLLSANVFYFDKIWDLNKDNFTDVTLQKRVSLFNKTNFERRENRVANIAARAFYENRWGGETQWNQSFRGGDSVYGESIQTKRLELLGNYQLPFFKDKLVLNSSINYHDQNSVYGKVEYLATQIIAFNQITFDKTIAKKHNLLMGAALRYTYYDDNTSVTQTLDSINKPSIIYLPGFFIQNDFKINQKHKMLVGMRYDINSVHGAIFSPRFNYKFTPNTFNTFRLSLGNGYRVVNLFSEEHAALTGARQVVIVNELKQEQSWNVSFNYVKYFSINKGFINLDANLFYTYFTNRIVPDYFTDANKIIFNNLNGYSINRGLNLSVDVTFNKNIKANLGFTLVEVFTMNTDSLNHEKKQNQIQTPPLTFNYGINYHFIKPKITIDINGTLTSPMLLPVLPNDFRPSESPWFALINLQITKIFKNNLSVYGGAKNLLNFVPNDPIMRPFDPFDKRVSINNPNNYSFDPSYNYAPLQGIRAFVGVRYSFK